MKQLRRNIKRFLGIFLFLFVAVTAGVILQSVRARTELKETAGESRAALRNRYALAGNILSADHVVLAGTDGTARTYADDPELAKAALHIVGDYTHSIAFTVESLWQNELLGQGRPFLSQLLLDLKGEGLTGNDIRLTLDSRLMREASTLLDGRKGAVVLLNYETGAVLASVSAPSVYPDQVIEWRDIPDTALFNRALQGQYTPGSTFKLVTAEAFLSQDAIPHDVTVHCTGETPLLPGGVSEAYRGAGHGDVNLVSAMADSCNHFFGKIGLELGAEALSDAAERFGFNRDFEMDRLPVAGSICDIGHGDEAALTWAAVGQAAGDDCETVTPLHLAMMAGMIGNQGIMRQPYVVEAFILPGGEEEMVHHASDPFTVISRENCDTLTSLMLEVVEQGTGTDAYHAGMRIAGKTGTAERVNEAGESVLSCLFAGFIADRTTPYAVAVVLDEASYGAALIAGRMLAAAASLID